MILRGATLSEKRVSLEGPRTERPALAAIRSVIPASAREAAVSVQMEVAPLAPLPASPPPPAPITLEAVLEWVADCTLSARAALAAHLAQDLDELRQAARAEGIAAGRAEGAAESRARSDRMCAVLDRIAQEAQKAFDTETSRLAGQCADIVALALGRIAGPLLTSPSATLGAVLEVLKRVNEERDIVIRVCAADLAQLQSAEERIRAALAGREVRLAADARVEAGGCIVESTLGSLDGRFDVQLRGLIETLRAAKLAPEETP